MTHRLLAALVAIALLPPSLPARAQGAEAWFSTEVRVPFDDTASVWPHWIRIANDFRYGAHYPWIGQALLRVGPIWEPHPMWSVATHLTSNIEQPSPGGFVQELRAELEPSVKGRWGALQWTDRLRIERRFFLTETRWRVRNRLHLAYQPPGWEWVPYLFEEAFVEDGLYNQNRVSLGASQLYSAHSRISLGYLLRSKRDAAGWDHAHALTFSFLFSPQMQPLLDDASSQ